MANYACTLPNGMVLNNRYEILNTLASGGFGITYVVNDRTNNIKRAMKEFYPRQDCIRAADGINVVPLSEDNAEVFNYGMGRFLNEADMLQTLRNIPEVVNVFDFFQENGTCYYIMEYINGPQLKELVKNNGGRMSWDTLKPLLAMTARALEKVHNHGQFHRDVGPDNIMLTPNSIKLIDFGNAKNLTKKKGETLSVYLKPGFAPIEQYSSKTKQGTYTDVYSLASTTYYCLAGVKPPDAFTRSQNDNYKHLTEYGIDPRVSDAIDHALALRPENRTQTMGQFLKELGIESNGSRQGSQGIKIPPVRKPGQQARPMIEISNLGKYEKYMLPANTMVTIGKSAARSNIVIDNNCVSRLHCEIFYDENEKVFYLSDKSSNGTFHNRKRLKTGEIVQLRPGSELELANNKCYIRLGVINE